MSEKELIIHPLVLVNISDHLHRARVNKIYPLCRTPEVLAALQSFQPPPEQKLPPDAGTKNNPRVMGALLGTVASGSTELFTSFEFPYEICPKTREILIDFKYVSKKANESIFPTVVSNFLVKKMFTSFEMLGWYSTGSDLYESDVSLQTQLSEIISNPIYLLFPNSYSTDTSNSTDTTGVNTLQLRFFETKYSSQGSSTLVESSEGYKVQFGDAERIGITEIHNSRLQLEPFDFISDYLKSLVHSLTMFSNRLTILRNYLKRNKEHQSLSDLRRIRSVCLQLNALSQTSSIVSPVLQHSLNSNHLVEYLTSISSNITSLNTLLKKYNTLFTKYIAGDVPHKLTRQIHNNQDNLSSDNSQFTIHS